MKILAPLDLGRDGRPARPRTRRLRVPTFLVLALAFLPAAHAQWQTTAYTLRGGWNAIYLLGDASHATVDAHFAGHPEVIKVWRWNTNPSQIQFDSSPLIPTAGTPEWSVWVRGQPGQTTLTTLIGQTPYLVECTGDATSTYNVPITQKTLPARSTWVRNGANLLGFPTRLNAGAYPFFSAYFATFPVAIATNTKIFKYVGGPLGPANPVQVFSPAAERLDRTQAYWFEAPVVGNFFAPIEVTPSNLDGLHFGRTGGSLTVRLRNRTAAPVTITVEPQASAAAPVGQEAITSAVPLTRRTFDAGTSSFVDAAFTAFNQVIGPQSSVELTFGVDRALMTGAVDALYASFVRFTDSGALMDIALPASARVASLAGLWIGDIAVNGVNSLVPGSPGATTARPFPLRVLLHVDHAGNARLLSQVFLGRLAPAPHSVGLCTRESALKPDDKAGAMRFVSTQLPPKTEISGPGTVALGATLVRTITIAFNAPTNPFVHTYHPDHDNKDARFEPLPTNYLNTAGTMESPTITRACSFTFALTPPVGVSAVGWGSSVLGGTYTETITGMHKSVLTVSGTFELRRASELGEITLN